MKKQILSALTILLVASGGMAQAPTDTLRLSLDDCLRIALNENPTVKVAEMEIERVDYSKKETIGKLFPDISFSGQYSRTLAKQTMYMDTGEGTMAIKVGRDNTHSVGFNATVPIIMPTLWKSLKLSDNQILQNVEAARASRLSLVKKEKNAYFAYLLAVDSKAVLEENHSTAKFNADIYAKKYELGTASEYDVLRSSVAVTNIEPSILEAENVITQCLLQLKVLMGMDVNINFLPNDALENYRNSMFNTQVAADTALVNNTNLRTLDLQTDYLKKALDVQKMSWFPTLTGSINYMWLSMSNGSPFKNFTWSPTSTAGLTLSIPISSGGQRYFKQKQAEVSLREMKWQRENLERSLQMQVQVQQDNINKSLKQIATNEGGVRQAKKANDIMQESFRIGAASFIQLLDTEDALLSARLAYYQAIYNYLVGQSDLEYVLGNAPLDKYVTTSTEY